MRIRSTKPEWPAERFDRRGHFKKAAIPAAVRRSVALAAGAVPGKTTPAPCHYCGAEGSVHWMETGTGRPGGWVALRGLEFDHVVSEFMGGPNTADNIVLACRPCNRRKGHR